ncbi:hypothetical protein [Flavobacterium frigoris]|uniref:hypothetical protein n=1 Tax=Flavobacterium frigoris TaxID=229204 RepID=UPI00158739EF|nr:hypothetical protein [Flavobacterium frigoris]
MILHNPSDVAVIQGRTSENKYTPIDLSVTNKSLEKNIMAILSISKISSKSN